MADAVGQASGSVGIGSIRGNVSAVLVETAAAERSLLTAYATAVHLNALGVLPATLREDYERCRLDVNRTCLDLYGTINGVLRRVGQGDVIPRPTPYPSLPPAHSSSTGTRGVSGAGLGIPPIIWAAAVLAALAQIAVVVTIIWVGADLVARVFAMRENTRRYERQVVDVRERFDACVRRTNNVAQCSDLFPTPNAPQENTAAGRPPFDLEPVMIGVGIGAVVLALGVVGYFFYEYASPGKLSLWRSSASMSTTPKGISSARGNPKRLTGASVSRALRGE